MVLPRSYLTQATSEILRSALGRPPQLARRLCPLNDNPTLCRSYFKSPTEKRHRSRPRSNFRSYYVAGVYYVTVLSFPVALLVGGLYKPSLQSFDEELKSVGGYDFDAVSTWHELLPPQGPVKSDGTGPESYCELLYKHEIRLLFLHPGIGDDDIHYHLEHISLQDRHPVYEALSYAWDHSTPESAVYGPQGRVNVTSHLHSALKQLRSSVVVRVLWIDYLCVDQSDLEERSLQVRIMGDVFSKAARVIIWLGEETHDVRDAFDVIRKLRFYFWRQYSWQQETPRLYRRVKWSKAWNEPILRREVEGAILEELDWQPLIDLLHRPWFHRLWVVQEVVNANRAVILCGGQEIPWSIVSSALWDLKNHGLATIFLDQYASNACFNVAAIEDAKGQRMFKQWYWGPDYQGFTDPLFHVMLATRFCECSDPRDRVFAVMSISQGRDIYLYDWEVDFNYSLSISELFKRFAIWDIIRCGSLRSLACATSPGAEQLQLPSWVPDWTRIEDIDPFVRYVNKTKFSASGRAKKDAWFSHNGTVLHVEGSAVDSVGALGPVPQFIKSTSLFQIDEGAIEQIDLINQWLQDCWRLAAGGKRTMTARRYEEFWRTMTCSLTGNGDPAPRIYSEYFRKYLEFMKNAPPILRFCLREPNHIIAPERSYRTADPLVTLIKYMHQTWCSIASRGDVTIGSEPSEYIPSEEFINLSRAFHEWYNDNHGTSALIESSLCVPKAAAVGDVIYILHGSEVPIVLRPSGDGSFTVIGECYVHGLMHGEALSLDDYEPKMLKIR